MDALEKKLISKRKQIFDEHVKITDEFLNSLRDSELVTSEDLKEIKTEKVNANRVTKMIEALNMTQTEGAFIKFCAVLIKDYAWVSKDLQLDLSVDKGELHLDEDVLHQASMLVHKKFGTSKRLSELDKKEMSELMALLLQVSKEDWKKELEQLREQLDHQCKLNATKDKKAVQLNHTVRVFLNENASKLTTHAHEMTTTSDIIRMASSASNENSSDDQQDERIDGLRFYTESLLGKVQKVLDFQDFIWHERDKCLKFLQVRDRKTPLDQVIAEKLKSMPQKLAEKDAEIEKHKIEEFRLKRLITDLNEEAERRDEKLHTEELKTMMYLEELKVLRQQRAALDTELKNVNAQLITANQRRKGKKSLT